MINAWKDWDGGKLFSELGIWEKFGQYFGTQITSPSQLESLLKQNENWFREIFIDNTLP